MNERHSLFRFGHFELDTLRHELRRRGHPVSISGATMDLLLLLLRSRGALVTRGEIVTALWEQPESVDVVQGVNTAITRLRAVLGDQASSPRFVQTVVGRGYRFIAPVDEVEPATVETSSTPKLDARLAPVGPGETVTDAAAARSPELPSPRPAGRPGVIWGMVGVAAALTLAVLVTQRWAGGKRRQLPQPEPRGDSAGQVQTPRYAPNPKAYDLYLQGRYASQKHTPEGVKRTIQLYKETIEADPQFAQAYASLAGNYVQSLDYDQMPQAEALALAESAAKKAVELDDSLAGAHSSMALVKAYAHWDWPGAEAEDRLAIRLDNQARFHANLGTLLAQVGRSDEALREGRLAVGMEPTSLAINAQLAESLYLARQYDAAIQQAQNTLRMEPGFYEAAETLAKALHVRNRDAEALDVMKHAAQPILGISHPRALLATVYAGLQQRSEGEAVLRALLASRGSPPCDAAVAEAGLGYVARASGQIRLAYLSHQACLIYIQTEPLYDPLRRDESFLEVQHELAFR